VIAKANEKRMKKRKRYGSNKKKKGAFSEELEKDHRMSDVEMSGKTVVKLKPMKDNGDLFR
jgi:hypothetical protein